MRWVRSDGPLLSSPWAVSGFLMGYALKRMVKAIAEIRRRKGCRPSPPRPERFIVKE